MRRTLHLRVLHGAQTVTMFDHVVRLRRERGITCLALALPPYWQVERAHRNTLKRVKTTRRAAWPTSFRVGASPRCRTATQTVKSGWLCRRARGCAHGAGGLHGNLTRLNPSTTGPPRQMRRRPQGKWYTTADLNREPPT